MIKFKPWHLDKWLSLSGTVIPYDKVEHFILGVILGSFLLLLPVSPFFGLFLFSLAAIGWEIRDGVTPYNSAGNIEGFSWKDLIADYAGGLVSLLWLVV